MPDHPTLIDLLHDVGLGVTDQALPDFAWILALVGIQHVAALRNAFDLPHAILGHAHGHAVGQFAFDQFHRVERLDQSDGVCAD